MATYKTVTVKPSQGDYSNLNAVNDFEATDLTATAGDLVIQCYNFVDTTQALFDAVEWVTDPTHRVVIQAVNDHGGKWNTGCYRMTGTATTIINRTVDYMTITGVQVNITSSGSNAGAFIADSLLNAVGTTVIDKLIMFGLGSQTAGYGVANNEPLHDVYIRNSLIYSTYRGLSSAGTGSTIYADNCTIDDCSDYGVYISYGGHRLRNTRITNCAAVTSSGTLHVDSNYNLTDGDVSGITNWGANSLDSTDTPTISYVDSTNADRTARDYHIQPNDSGVGAGMDLSGDGWSDDIDGDARS